MTITTFAAKMFQGTTSYVPPAFIGITPPSSTAKKAKIATKRKGRSEAQKAARKARDQAKKKEAA